MTARRTLLLLAQGLPPLLACLGAAARMLSFNIASGDLEPALSAYAAQSGIQLIYRIDDVRGRSTPGLQGTFEAEQALRVLVQGSSLDVCRDISGAMVIFAAPPARPCQRPR